MLWNIQKKTFEIGTETSAINMRAVFDILMFYHTGGRSYIGKFV